MSGPLDYDALIQSGLVNSYVHRAVRRVLSAGVTGRELDAVAAAEIRAHGAIPSFQALMGFPSVICVSVNDVIGHGIPGDQPVARGDLVKIDIGVGVGDVHTDCARTYRISPEDDDVLYDSPPNDLVTQLMAVTEQALWAGIAAARPGRRASDISHAVASVIEGSPFAVFRQAFGHGLGETLHESPQLASFGPPNMGPRLRVGQVIAIEPVVVTGLPYKRRGGQWSDRTLDGGWAAHFEDTVLVCEDGPRVVTREASTADLIPSRQTGLSAYPQLDGLIAREKQAKDDAWVLEMARTEMNDVLMEAWGRLVDPVEVLHPENAQTIVLERDDATPVGFFAIRHERSLIHLVTIVVAREYQGRGIGSQVMSWLEQRAKWLNVRSVELWVQTNNTGAVRFYEKLGYQVVGTPFVSTLAMHKQVSTA